MASPFLLVSILLVRGSLRHCAKCGNCNVWTHHHLTNLVCVAPPVIYDEVQVLLDRFGTFNGSFTEEIAETLQRLLQRSFFTQ